METGGVWLRSLKGDRGGVIFSSRLETLASPVSSLARNIPVSWLGDRVREIVATGFRAFLGLRGVEPSCVVGDEGIHSW